MVVKAYLNVLMEEGTRGDYLYWIRRLLNEYEEAEARDDPRIQRDLAHDIESIAGFLVSKTR